MATQVLRRSPVNVRPILRIPPLQNPKALALFASSAMRLGLVEEGEALRGLLVALGTRTEHGVGWGYPFHWQARAFLLPAGTPSVVVTSFVAEALCDGTGRQDLVSAACDFVLCDLHRTEDSTGACLSYSPTDRSAVYNASVLGAKMLTRAAQVLSRPDLLDTARPLVTYVLARQQVDGSWGYGEASHHQWIDNFHTGFVLNALDTYRRATGDLEVERAVIRGAEFWERTFFGPDGEPHYYAHRRYPYDVHCAAQAILTFLQLRDLMPGFEERARRTARWMVTNLMDADGSFYYQVRRTHTVRIRYMRWSQAWATRALAEMVHCAVDL